jgi:hypothetical protein
MNDPVFVASADMLNTALAKEVTSAGYIPAFVIAVFPAVSLTAAGGAVFAIAGMARSSPPP